MINYWRHPRRLMSASALIGISAVVAGCAVKEPSHSVSANPAQRSSENPAVPAIATQAIWPRINSAVKSDPRIEQAVAEQLRQMTLAQKVAQMIQPEIGDISVADMRQYGFGSYLNGGGSFPNRNKHATADDWVNLAEAMYQAAVDDSLDGSRIPTMWGTDAVHGHNNVIGATIFPHNIGLGATNNPALIEQIAAATATEVMVTGIDWVFAPTVAVVRDDRWGRTYEGYSEDPRIVKNYAAAIVKGLQGSGQQLFGDRQVISTVKHFIGDGGTVGGDDQGNNIASEADLFRLHAQGYVGGLTAGAQTVMASFNSWHGDKSHGNRYLLTEVLKQTMGFDGLVVGDWNGHGQVVGCSNDSCPQAINAGLDIFMAPGQSWRPLYDNTIAQVNRGEIPMSRIDDAVSRILRVKYRAGLFSKPSPKQRLLAGKTAYIGHQDHRAIARQAVRESLVLLKNRNQLLPLAPNQRVLVAGDAADNIGKQAGGWTITWQGTGNSNADFPGGTSIYAGFKQVIEGAGGHIELSPTGQYQQKPDVAIVVFGEEPYAEGNGDLDNLEYQRGNKRDLALLKKLQADGIKVVSVFISGRPMWVNPELNASDAFVAAWLPGSEGQGIADVLFSDVAGKVRHPFTGKLAYSWPQLPSQTAVNVGDVVINDGTELAQGPLLPYGFGLVYDEAANQRQGIVLTNQLSEDTGIDNSQIAVLELLRGAVKAPWTMVIGTDKNRDAIVSASQHNEVVSLRTIDKQVQEDARLITFNGKGLGYVSLSSDFPEDLRSYFESDGALTMQLKVNAAPADKVLLQMNCQNDCDAHQQQDVQGSIDLSPILVKLSLSDWQSVSIDLACFKQDSTHMAKVFTPFMLATKGRFSVSIADITIVPNSAKNATLNCH